MKFLCALLAVVMLTACAFGACAEAEPVAFADAAVEQAIRETLGVSADAPLTNDDLAMILVKTLNLSFFAAAKRPHTTSHRLQDWKS